MIPRPRRLDPSAVLPLGFGTTAALWGIGYVCRLPGVMAPSGLVLALMLGCLFCGGFVAGRRTGEGFRAGAAAGALSSVLNLLVLGSLLGGSRPSEVVPSALWWVPGSILAAVVVAGLGAMIGTRTGAPPEESPDWTAAFTKVAAATTLLLLFVGGLVTSEKAGLAVVDWPRSYGYNMFLYPLSRMTGGIYYEHAHRLFGSLVGLTTVVLAIQLHRLEERAWIRRLGIVAVVLVVAQGILGGLRVTGRFTLSSDASVTEPNIYLAVVHGVLAQVFFSLLVLLAVATSGAWKRARTASDPSAALDRGLAWVLVGTLFVQLVLGATLRHLDAAVYVHAGLGTLLLPFGMFCGTRAVSSGATRSLRWSGFLLMGLVLTQFMLGLATLIATRVLEPGPAPTAWSVGLATAHQGTGALVLASALMLALWTQRLRLPVLRHATAPGMSVP